MSGLKSGRWWPERPDIIPNRAASPPVSPPILSPSRAAQMLLYEAALQRLGHEAIVTDARVLEYATHETGVNVRVQQAGETRDHRACSSAPTACMAVRAQMYPGKGPVH